MWILNVLESTNFLDKCHLLLCIGPLRKVNYLNATNYMNRSLSVVTNK